MLSENCLISFTFLGGYNYDDGDSNYYDEILEYEPSTGEWSLVDQMRSAREYHAVSVISTEEINIYC